MLEISYIIYNKEQLIIPGSWRLNRIFFYVGGRLPATCVLQLVLGTSNSGVCDMALRSLWWVIYSKVNPQHSLYSECTIYFTSILKQGLGRANNCIEASGSPATSFASGTNAHSWPCNSADVTRIMTVIRTYSYVRCIECRLDLYYPCKPEFKSST